MKKIELTITSTSTNENLNQVLIFNEFSELIDNLEKRWDYNETYKTKEEAYIEACNERYLEFLEEMLGTSEIYSMYQSDVKETREVFRSLEFKTFDEVTKDINIDDFKGYIGDTSTPLSVINLDEDIDSTSVIAIGYTHYGYDKIEKHDDYCEITYSIKYLK